jgi:hypothetical protein
MQVRTNEGLLKVEDFPFMLSQSDPVFSSLPGLVSRACGSELRVIVRRELSLPDFQFVDHIEQLAAKRYRNIKPAAFANQVPEREVDLGLYAALKLAQRAFAVVKLP